MLFGIRIKIRIRGEARPTSRSLDRDACNEKRDAISASHESRSANRAVSRTERKSPMQNGRQKGSFLEAGSGGVAGE